MKLSFSEMNAAALSTASGKSGGTAVILVDGAALPQQASAWDKASKGALTAALKSGRFTGKKGQFLSVVAPAGLNVSRVVLAGAKSDTPLSTNDVEDIGGGLVAHLNQNGVKDASVLLTFPKSMKLKAAEAAAYFAFGAQLRSYRFDKYRTTEKAEKKPTLASLTLFCAQASAATAAHKPLVALAEGIFFTRNLVSEPANVIYPESLAAKCRELSKLGVKVEVLGEAQMKKLGMGALLGVGQGSVRESQLVIMQWNGNAKQKDKPLAFVGKGVCFDTGGISIKPSGGMEEMKWDMGGAGTVIGLMRALAGRKAKVNAIGIVGLVENMPDGNAQRPGDVVTSMSGQTIEVINTDAEGRLVLADALWYTQKRFKPRFIIDLATLTGAIIVALGHEKAGLFSNDDKLVKQLEAAADETGEALWHLPLGEVYERHIDSDIADMKNVGENRSAGSISAAIFLQRFVGKTPWAHLDIAGTAWAYKDYPTCPKGASAFGVKLLNRLVQEHYE